MGLDSAVLSFLTFEHFSVFLIVLAIKRILYDMGLLALVRWLLQRAFKFEPPFGP